MAHDEVFSALAEPTRRRIVEALKDEPKAVGSLVEQLEISQPTVSKHLKVLREAGLVAMTAAGQRRIYSLQAPAFAQLRDWAALFAPAPAAPAVVQAPVEPAAPIQPVVPAAVPPASSQAPLGRSVGRGLEQVTERAQGFLEKLPRFGRRR